MSLECAPMKHCRFPVYPTRLEILADPDLLKRHIPPAWLSRGEMAGLLSVFLAVNGTGCSKDQPAGSSTRPAGNDLAGKAAIVAPVFEHGEGRGATGCVVVNPPVFLSEEEALQVITEELARAGLSSFEQEVTLEGVLIPPRRLQFKTDWVGGSHKAETVAIPERAKPLKVDLNDPTHRIAVEFIAHADYLDLGGASSMSTVQGYDMKDAASWVGKHVREQGRGLYAAVLYDPVARLAVDRQPGDWRKQMEEKKAESKRLLRLQVKDFVDWLKGQGAI